MKFVAQKLIDFTSTTAPQEYNDWLSAEYVQGDADYLSTATQTDIAVGSLVWDTVGGVMYESIDATNDLPNTVWTDTDKWNKQYGSYILETDNDNLTNASVVKYGNYYYRSLTNSNVGNNPEETVNVFWVKYSISNINAMIDLSSQTQTIVDAANLVVEFNRSLIVDTLGLGNIEASSITVEHLTAGVPDAAYTQVIDLSVSDEVIDDWTYDYSEYSSSLRRNTKVDLPVVGDTIRVTFAQDASTSRSACGFFIAGEAVDMGETLSGVGFSFKSFAIKETDDFGTLSIVKRNVQDIVDFETSVPKELTMVIKDKVKRIYNDIVLFIVDPSDNAVYEHMLTLGVIENASTLVEVGSQNYFKWSVIEST